MHNWGLVSRTTGTNRPVRSSVAPGILLRQFSVRDDLSALPGGIFVELGGHEASGGGSGGDARAGVEEECAGAAGQDVFELAGHFVANGPDDFGAAEREGGMEGFVEAGVGAGEGVEGGQVGAVDLRPIIERSRGWWGDVRAVERQAGGAGSNMRQSAESGGAVDGVLGHFAVGGPFAAKDGDQMRVRDEHGVIARDGGGAGGRGMGDERALTGPDAEDVGRVEAAAEEALDGG